MTDDPSAEWPDPTYHIGQRDHLHALGVIIASYNQLEFSFFIFFMRYLNIATVPAQKLFELVSNPNLIDLLRDAVNDTERDDRVKESVLYFIAGVETLAGIRNFLAHSQTILNDPNQDHLTFGKGSRRQPNVWGYSHLNREDLRAIADSMRAFHTFGSHLDMWISARATGGRLLFGSQVHVPSFPEKPPQPTKLTSSPHGVLE
jgi:hypothetical protein